MRVVAVIFGTLVGVGVVLLGPLMAGMRWQVGPQERSAVDVAGLIPGRTMRTLRLFGVSQCLSLEKS
jgi:hypothetical protein